VGKLKFKTRKAAAKRFKIKKSGKIFRYKANKKHILEHKKRKNLRKMGRMVQVSKSDEKRIKKMMGV
jgi:large subunit ribosomal protein L35